MTKYEFLTQLRGRLAGLPPIEIAEREFFYSEMIDDRMEEGLSEEEAVAAIGSLDDVMAQITAERSEKHGRKRGKGVAALVIVGSPIWMSLLIAAFAVVISLYVSLWAVLFSLWSAFVALIGGGFGAVLYGVGLLFGSNFLSGAVLIGAGFVCAGLGIFLFFGCKTATVGCTRLTKAMMRYVKNKAFKKEEA